ncbi:MAG: hypothetical protein H0T64_08650 [Pyrinomonadaceae bacterium]|nr:hypothetical protein [Pyrinomonadaceae bacterium]
MTAHEGTDDSANLPVGDSEEGKERAAVPVSQPLQRTRRAHAARQLAADSVIRPTGGTPQDGIISPILANVYLHYVLDLWFAKVFRRCGRGAAFLLRYADDFVCGFEKEEDAQRFYKELEERLRKFGLEVAAAKTRVIPFSRYHSGETSFEFLGFEFRWGKDRQGRDRLKRRTSRKKFRSSLKRAAEWCKNRHLRMKEQFRRSQRPSYTWDGYLALLQHFALARPRIVGRPKSCLVSARC